MANELVFPATPIPKPWRMMLMSSYEDSPFTGLSADREEALGTQVDRTCAEGLSPSTVRVLRKWLYGPPATAGGGGGNGNAGDGGNGADVSDHALLRFVEAAGLALGPKHRYTGPVWDATAAKAEMRVDGVWAAALAEEGLPPDAPATALTRSWVDYAVRLAVGTTRTGDRYYGPVDVAAAKAAWGARVTAAAVEQEAAAAAAVGNAVEDDGEWGLLRPGEVWEAAVRGRLPPLTSADGGGGGDVDFVGDGCDAQTAALQAFTRRQRAAKAP